MYRRLFSNKNKSGPEPKHIVVDARNWRSSTGRYTFKLIENLQKIDSTNRYTVLVPKNDAWKPDNPNFSKKEINVPQFSINPWQEIKFAAILYRLNPSLVHFTMTQQPLLFWPLRAIMRRFGSRIVTTTHDLTMLRFTRPGRYPKWFHKLRMSLYRLQFWVAHRRSHQIIVPTNYVKSDLVNHHKFTKNKISVTLEACDPPSANKPQAIKGIKAPFIFHAGSPLPHKNLERLTEAFTILKEDYPDLQLVLIGKKEFYFRQLEESLVNHPYRRDIHMPGFVTDQQLVWTYQNAACYVLPSLSEGFGLPGLEAMANGSPLASSNATCLPEVYGQAALFFDPYDIYDMAHVVGKIIGNKRLTKELIGKGSKQWRKYSWEKMARETLEVYSLSLH